MINSTCLKSLAVRVRIFVAMRKAMLTGITQYITNRNGQVYMSVKRVKSSKGRAFQFYGKLQRDLTETVYNSLKN